MFRIFSTMACAVCENTDGCIFHVKYDDVLKGAEVGCSRCAFISTCVRLCVPDTKQLDRINTQIGHYLQVWHLGKNVGTKLDIFTEYGRW